jgi:two-component sensor histidine kinase
VRLEGPRLWLSPAAAQVIGVVLHELATNAAKHGALSALEGTVDIAWKTDARGDLHLSWMERNGPAVNEPSRRSFGTQVIERNVPDQLGGATNIEWLASGLRAEFVIPAAHVMKREPFQHGSHHQPHFFAG